MASSRPPSDVDHEEASQRTPNTGSKPEPRSDDAISEMGDYAAEQFDILFDNASNSGEDVPFIRSIREKVRRPVIDRTKYIAELENYVLEQLRELSSLRDERDALERKLSDSVDEPLKGHDESLELGETKSSVPEYTAKVARLTWTKWTATTTIIGRGKWNIVEVLGEKPRSILDFQMPAFLRRHFQKFLAEPVSSTATAKGEIERIRINSPFLHTIFGSMLGDGAPVGDHTVFLKPFKLLVGYEEALQSILVDLRKDLESRERTRGSQSREWQGPTKSSQAAVEVEKARQSPKSQATQQVESDVEPRQEQEPDAKATVDHDAEDSDTETEPEVKLTASPEMIQHLEFLLRFICSDLKGYLHTYRRLRAREAKKVAFKDLWYLFAPGDKIYNASYKQAYQVLSVCGGRSLLSQHAAQLNNPYGLPPPPGSPPGHLPRPPPPEKVSGMDDITAFVIDCVCLSFDGQNLGPVSHSISILPYEGEQAIESLRVFPLEYARVKTDTEDGPVDMPMEAQLSQRGERFIAFMDTEEVAHREYVGLSVGSVREQINSRVVIDIGLFYERNPNSRPLLWSFRHLQADPREVTERNTCRCPTCMPSTNMHIYNDAQIDRQRTSAFISENAKNWRLIRDAKTKLTPDQLSLLPANVYGYVLRSRKWNLLNVDRIMPVKQNPENFRDLVLPAMYKQLVEGMVRTHSRGVKPSTSGREESTQAQRSDLVRGKGKGVIILLHGVPGVGKTSTAECVAEYTYRPLFSITCGDIGESAQQVERNLEENFQLAHRWGCVMLLDEADVFLQTRNKQDMQRNAVVSVFLRILEYYSGILFLTTNKVGTFDEAFKSRIHLSLYYPPLDPEQTTAIWNVNLSKLKRNHPNLVIEEGSIMAWVDGLTQNNERDRLRPWNGRQIHNACQTAASIAMFKDGGKLTLEHFQIVAKASMTFDKYLRDVHGADDSGRAKRAQDRNDEFWDGQMGNDYGPARDRDGYRFSSGQRRDDTRYDGGMARGRSRYGPGDDDRFPAGQSRTFQDEPGGYLHPQDSRWGAGREAPGPGWMSSQETQQSRRRQPPEPQDTRWPSGLDPPDSRWSSNTEPLDARWGAGPEPSARSPRRHNTFED